jgi:hypothetical protein
MGHYPTQRKHKTMYTHTNYKTKKSLKDAIKAGKRETCYAPGFGRVPENGPITLEGPHYPAPHAWYAQGIMKDGYLVSVK